MNEVTILHEMSFTVCPGWKYFSFVPRYHRQLETWPKQRVFQWLCFWLEIESKPDFFEDELLEEENSSEEKNFSFDSCSFTEEVDEEVNSG